MTLSPKLSVVEISTLWHYRLSLLIQMFIKVVSSPRLSGIGMPSPILSSHLPNMQRIVLLSSLLWWELGTNCLITSPGEWLLFRRFTSKLSGSWSSPVLSYPLISSTPFPHIPSPHISSPPQPTPLLPYPTTLLSPPLPHHLLFSHHSLPSPYPLNWCTLPSHLPFPTPPISPFLFSP